MDGNGTSIEDCDVSPPCSLLRMALFNALEMPVCLVRAKEGIVYPEILFQDRTNSIKNLSIHEIPGGHHVHMDENFAIKS